MGKIKRTTEQFKKEMSTINPDIEILGEYTGSHNKILCYCKLCGHKWETLPKTLLKGIGCPSCAIRKNAEYASEKARLKFLELTESDKCRSQLIGKWINYETKTLFRCKDCGNEWETSPHSIANNRGCPKCGLKRRIKIRSKTQEEFLEEMQRVNPETEVLGEYVNNKTKVKCKCKICGNLFEMTPNHLLEGHGCSVCTSSLGEKIIVRILNRYNISYNAQQSFPKEEVNGLTVHVDFFTGSTVIEYNGRQHYEAVEYFGGPDQLIKQQYRDNIVKDFCKNAGYDFIEIPYTADTEELIEEYLINVLKEGEMNDVLIARDAKGKIRVIELRGYWEESLHGFVIDRVTYQLGGKKSQQPFIIITEGKAKRSVLQQFELQYNSELKKYLDKGYKKIKDLGITDLTIEAADNALPVDNTDQSGMIKPMLCKVMDRDKSSQTDKQWLASYKHDGVRALLFLRDGEVHTASRGGQDYDIPATYIREDPYVKQIFKENPEIILDGEIYRHLWPLQRISGLCRREDLVEDHKELVFHCYDIVDTTLPFKLRAKKLGELRDSRPDNSRIIFVEHRPVKGLDQIMQMHDEAIAAGYEGLVVRDPEKEYKPGARDSRMMKIKCFSDDEFLITGLAEGLRDEDMCFTLQTEDGTEFKAKPVGDRLQKQWYREHLDEIVGQMGTVKHFGWTVGDHPVPNLPVFKAVRWSSDLD